MLIAIDQYGTLHKIPGMHARKGLLKAFSASSAKKMFIDDENGEPKHVGYIINDLWLSVYVAESFEFSGE